MTASLMLNSHQVDAAPWAWTLSNKEARTLHAETLARWLHVESGSVWLTRVNGSEQANDIWLAAGESLALPAGTAWVVEAWPPARLSLLQQAQLADGPGRARGAWTLAAARRSTLLSALQRALAA